VKELIQRESKSADRLVIAGDLADMFSFSRFRKAVKRSEPVRDFVETQAVLKVLSDNFERVELLPGNHDERPMKFFADHLPVEVMEYLRLTAPGALSPLAFMAKAFPNVTIPEPRRSGDAEFGFIHQIGDLVIGHPETYSKLAGKSVQVFSQWVHQFAIPAGLVKAPVSAIAMGHTHGSSRTWSDFGVWTYELGCMCRLADYCSDPRCRTPRPWKVGYTIFVQEAAGKTLHNESQFIALA
jgi:hypothetical protein